MPVAVLQGTCMGMSMRCPVEVVQYGHVGPVPPGAQASLVLFMGSEGP